jgi:hypothetical protein
LELVRPNAIGIAARRDAAAIAPAHVPAQTSFVHQRMVFDRSGRPRRKLARVSKWLTLGGAFVMSAAGAVHVRAQATVLAAVAPPKAEPSEEVIPLCKTDLRLSGAVFNARHPERSFALVQVRENEPAGLVRVGFSLSGFQLLAIEPRGILMRNADGRCWLRLTGDAAARTRRASSPPRRVTAKQAARHKKSEVVVIGHR